MTELPPDTPVPADERPAKSDPVSRFFGGSPPWVIAKLVMLSIVIGVILAVLGLDALAILRALEDLFYSFFENIWGALESLLRWFLLGAVIVFPIWIVMRLLKLGKD